MSTKKISFVDTLFSSPLLLMAIGFTLWSCNSGRTHELIDTNTHVVVIGFDGLSPDGLKNADTPTFDRLISEGSSSMHARAVLPTSSSSNWASMIMGAGPEQHGITSNSWESENLTLPAVTQSEPFLFSTIFHLIRREKKFKEIGAIYQWGGFGRLFGKSDVDFDENPLTEDETAVIASRYIKTKNPLFTFVHFDHVDHAGHEYGHGSEEYYKSVEKADGLLAGILTAIGESEAAKNTLVIISADHGGKGKGHGGESLEEIEIPFIIWGKGIKSGYDLKFPVYQYDNAATVAFALGLDTPRAWIGKPVKEAFKGIEVNDAFPILIQLNKPIPIPKAKGFAADGGLYTDSVSMLLKNPNKEGQIRFTLNGGPPQKNSQVFLRPVVLSENTVVKSGVFVNNVLSSGISEAYYRIKPSGLKEPVSFEAFYLENLSFIPALENKIPDVQGSTFEISSEEVHQFIRPNTVFRFRSNLRIRSTDNYKFAIRSDDGSQLFIDNKLVIDNDGDHGVRSKTGNIDLYSGDHSLEVLWFNAGGDGWLDVYFEGKDIPFQILSTNSLMQN